MIRLRPVRDRILCARMPVRNPSVILRPDGCEQSTRSSGVEFRVVAVGAEVKEVRPMDIIIIPNTAFANMANTHIINGEDHCLFHELDVDAVLEEP